MRTLLDTTPIGKNYTHPEHTPIVKDRSRLWKAGVRDLLMDLCCALHNFRVRLTPWQPMV
jgi:hypothetical protein